MTVHILECYRLPRVGLSGVQAVCTSQVLPEAPCALADFGEHDGTAATPNLDYSA